MKDTFLTVQNIEIFSAVIMRSEKYFQVIMRLWQGKLDFGWLPESS